MTKLEMAKRPYELSDKKDRVKLEDFANLVFYRDSLKDVLEKIML